MIKQSKDGYYRTSITVNGKRYNVAGKTEAEAHRKAGALKAELKAGIKAKTGTKTVSEFCAEWLAVYRDTGSSNDVRYKQIVNNIIIPEIGHLKISDITEQRLQQLLNNNAHYSKSQLSKIRLTLKQIFRKARKNRLIIDDPAEDLTLPVCKAGTHRAITHEERKMILKAAETHRAGIYIKIMLYCGLRENEIDALQWLHVDLQKRVIHVRQAVKHGTNEIGLPKSKAGVRDVPIPAVLLPDLLSAEGEPTAFVCPNETGSHHTSASRNRLWNAFKRFMDIENGATVYRNRIIQTTLADDLTLYCLRHTYCTDLQRAGVPLNVAKTLMGHEDISVTANIYTHTSDADAQQAVSDLDAYIKKSGSEEPEEESNIVYFKFG